MQKIGATRLVAASLTLSSLAAQAKAEERILRYKKSILSNYNIRLGVIGYGVQWHFDSNMALNVPGV